jgi:hypothetical protein
MGTKGQKNTPITARVNAGLFNQKKGITEPLLNVGPAGVYGDNQTKDIPSPSKIKGYSMKASPFKQVNTNVITLGEGTEGTEGTEETVIKGDKVEKIETDNDKYLKSFESGFAKDNEGFDNITDYRLNREGKYKDKITPGTKGSDPVEGVDEADSIPIKTKDDNDAMSPWRVRQQSRSIKKSGKDVRQSQNKLDSTDRKLKKLKEAGITSGRKFDRLTSKQTENTRELDAFTKNQTARTRQVEMSSDPLGKNRTFKSAERNLEKGDLTTGEQDTRNKEELKVTKIKEAAAAKAAEAKAIADAKAITDAKAAGNTSPAMKTANNFFKTRSPMKKSYFK